MNTIVREEEGVLGETTYYAKKYKEDIRGVTGNGKGRRKTLAVSGNNKKLER